MLTNHSVYAIIAKFRSLEWKAAAQTRSTEKEGVMRPHMLEITHRNEGIFLAATGLLLLDTLMTVTNVFSHGLFVTIVASLMISLGSMNVVAWILEGGLMLPVKEQYYAFVFGDSLCLPTIIAALYLMRQHQHGPTLADNGWWKFAWMAIGIVSGLIWQLIMEPSNKTPTGEYFYSDGQLHSPTHLWHSLFVIPVFIYVLGSQLPLLFTSSWGLKGLTSSPVASIPVLMIVVAAVGFFLIVQYDGKHPKPRASIRIHWDHPLEPHRRVI